MFQQPHTAPRRMSETSAQETQGVLICNAIINTDTKCKNNKEYLEMTEAKWMEVTIKVSFGLAF